MTSGDDPSGGSARLELRSMEPEDWPEVRTIYRQGIETGHATFETEVPPRERWNEEHLDRPRLVAVTGDGIVGWATLTPVSGRCVYAGVAEVSVYVAEGARGRGVGKLLLSALVRASEEEEIWTLQAGIFPENEASLALHESEGFRVVGVRERLGQLGGTWRDVVLLERRSEVVGR